MAASNSRQQTGASSASRLLAILIILAGIAGIGGMLAVALAAETKTTDTACPADAECITIHTESGDHLFTVEWAVDRAQQACGLMFRTEMAADHGMVFDFGVERPVAFWMHNTLIPLDMVFIRADGGVLNIAKNTTPLSDASVPSDGPVRYVLEINGGVSDEIGLAPGDTIDLARAAGMTEGTAICYPGPA